MLNLSSSQHYIVTVIRCFAYGCTASCRSSWLNWDNRWFVCTNLQTALLYWTCSPLLHTTALSTATVSPVNCFKSLIDVIKLRVDFYGCKQRFREGKVFKLFNKLLNVTYTCFTKQYWISLLTAVIQLRLKVIKYKGLQHWITDTARVVKALISLK